jgi:N-ethylmaleimide reductase
VGAGSSWTRGRAVRIVDLLSSRHNARNPNPVFGAYALVDGIFNVIAFFRVASHQWALLIEGVVGHYRGRAYLHLACYPFSEYWQNPSRLISTPHGWIQPSPHRAIEKSEIPCVLELYSGAVKHAREAGFDGVEVHAGNGYFIDQFLQDGSNKRTDEYGGPIENRTRLLFEVVDAMVSAWSGDRVAVRITPGGTFNAMTDSDPEALHSYIAEGLTRFGLAYLHIIEPRMSGSMVIKDNQPPIATQRARNIYKGKIVANGGFEPGTAANAVEEGEADAISFGRYFVSNPDLPKRIREELPLAAYDRDTFYTFEAKGYTDYPFYNRTARV